ncbi:UbiA family prenyltransferase [Gimesia aquarii]|uniref:Prenyltransferase n=1 Tax=Gimesia aquarii TaxID=2527964 RepID=A0A517W2I3_9PLAN|nr:UbiA family prenyltransferase [Gimesia aquarii]QDT99462.1 prenyltransferase [Gimesia aquarii]
MKKWLAYFQLMRLPAVFTAMSDILLGYLLTHNSFELPIQFALLIVASTSLYLSGMVFNDVFDRKVDAEERPSRPIPSGRISTQHAAVLGGLLMLAGVGAAQAVGKQSLIVASLLVVAILSYDSILKRTILGPLAMGLCRFLNVMLGASAVAREINLWVKPQLRIAAILGMYVVGLTWFARMEAKNSHRGHLLGGTLVINAGLAALVWMIATYPWPRELNLTMLLTALGVVVLTINRRLIQAILNPVPQNVQIAVKTMLYSYVMLNAIIVFVWTTNPQYAILTAALLIPTIVLSRWMSVT